MLIVEAFQEGSLPMTFHLVGPRTLKKRKNIKGSEMPPHPARPTHTTQRIQLTFNFIVVHMGEQELPDKCYASCQTIKNTIY